MVDFLVCCLGVSVRFAVGFMLVLFRVAIVFAVFVVWLSFAVLCGFVACCLRLWWYGSSCKRLCLFNSVGIVFLCF